MTSCENLSQVLALFGTILLQLCWFSCPRGDDLGCGPTVVAEGALCTEAPLVGFAAFPSPRDFVG